MNIEFHYYMVCIVAQRAGFSIKDSYTLAYTSQYVDDNSTIYQINKGLANEYSNYISQTRNILKPRRKLLRIYPCFHFVPGKYDSRAGRRRDGKMHILYTTPDSANSRKLMQLAFDSGNVYRMGIAAHCYADAWAHQNFVGYYDSINGMNGLLNKLSPDIGHADAGYKPDIPSLIWQDTRLISKNQEVHNKKRFLSAARHLFSWFIRYKKPEITAGEISVEWRPVARELNAAMGDEFSGRDLKKRQRLDAYKELIAGFKLYDKKMWFDTAITTNVRGLPDMQGDGLLGKVHIFDDVYIAKKGFKRSSWYLFQEAVKEHQRIAVELYKPLFEQMEVSDNAEL